MILGLLDTMYFGRSGVYMAFVKSYYMAFIVVYVMMRPQGGLVDMMSLSRFCLGRFKGFFLLYVLGVFQRGGKQLSTSFRSPLMSPPMLWNVSTRQMYATSGVQAAIVFAHA